MLLLEEAGNRPLFFGAVGKQNLPGSTEYVTGNYASFGRIFWHRRSLEILLARSNTDVVLRLFYKNSAKLRQQQGDDYLYETALQYSNHIHTYTHLKCHDRYQHIKYIKTRTLCTTINFWYTGSNTMYAVENLAYRHRCMLVRFGFFHVVTPQFHDR